MLKVHSFFSFQWTVCCLAPSDGVIIVLVCSLAASLSLFHFNDNLRHFVLMILVDLDSLLKNVQKSFVHASPQGNVLAAQRRQVPGLTRAIPVVCRAGESRHSLRLDLRQDWDLFFVESTPFAAVEKWIGHGTNEGGVPADDGSPTVDCADPAMSRDLAIVVGPSGCGKTRTLFEIAKAHRLLYCDCSHAGEAPSGYRDLTTHALFSDCGRISDVTMIWHFCRASVLARYAFASRHSTCSNIDFLKMQLNGGQTEVVEIYDILKGLSAEHLESVLQEMWLARDVNTLPIVAIDEAHLAADKCRDIIISDEPKVEPQTNRLLESSKRGLLKPLLHCFRERVGGSRSMCKKVVIIGNDEGLKGLGALLQSDAGRPVEFELFDRFTPLNAQQQHDWWASWFGDREFSKFVNAGMRPRCLEVVMQCLVDGTAFDSSHKHVLNPNLMPMLADAVERAIAEMNKTWKNAIDRLGDLATTTLVQVVAASNVTCGGRPVPTAVSVTDCTELTRKFCFVADFIGEVDPASDAPRAVVISEPWVQDFCELRFAEELRKCPIWVSVQALRQMLQSQGSAATGKGVAFEVATIEQLKLLVGRKWKTIGDMLQEFSLKRENAPPEFVDLWDVALSADWRVAGPGQFTDNGFIQNRPTNIWHFPGNLFRPDSAGFLRHDVAILNGNKLFGANISCNKIHFDNFLTTDPARFYLNQEGDTKCTVLREEVVNILLKDPIKVSIRNLFVFPRIAKPRQEGSNFLPVEGGFFPVVGEDVGGVTSTVPSAVLIWDMTKIDLFSPELQAVLKSFCK